VGFCGRSAHRETEGFVKIAAVAPAVIVVAIVAVVAVVDAAVVAGGPT